MNTLLLLCCLAIQPQPDNLVVPIGGSSQVLIPVAGNVPGENGTHFHSDIAVVNLRGVTQRVQFQWIPQVGSPERAPFEIDIPAGTAIRVEHFVRDVLGITGLGSIVVTGMASASTGDPAAVLYVTSRIWTIQPGTSGTSSQTLSTIPTTSINTPTAAIFGLRRDNRYRVNVGVINLDATRTQTFQITDGNPPSTVHTVTLPPLTMHQVGFPRVSADLTQVLITNATPEATRSNLWTAYGSSVDNVTGDSWSELAIAGTP